jgi:hypothetical protein
MTIVNTSHKFIFVHIPKTAGTSVKRFFSAFTRYCDVEVGGAGDAQLLASYYGRRFGLKKHSFASEILRSVGAEDYAQFYKFSIVRNPYARVESTFTFLKYKWKNWPNAKIMDRFSNVNEFVTSDFFKKRGPDHLFEPQIRWLVDANGEKCVDYIGHVETLEDALRSICDTLRLDTAALKVEKKNVSKNMAQTENSPSLSGNAIDVVLSRYEKDFDFLGYSREPI